MTSTKEVCVANGVSEVIVPEKKLIWTNVIVLASIHLICAYSLTRGFLVTETATVFFNFFYGEIAGFGVTAGVHRLWTHRSYKAKLPLRILLATLYFCTGMNPIFDWVRDHRVHHKFSETDADPHNSKRGLFFAHCGWLMQKKHPEVKRRGREIDMSDVLADPVVKVGEMFFYPIVLSLSFIIPITIPCYYWNETVLNSVFASITRWVISLNSVWSVNSFAHIYGNKPYNKDINPSENVMVSIVALGEGWHNYHHTFPWDYKTAELGIYDANVTTAFIDFFAWIGWAYDLKQPSKKLIQNVVESTGDGTHTEWGHKEVEYEKVICDKEQICQNGDKVKGI